MTAKEFNDFKLWLGTRIELEKTAQYCLTRISSLKAMRNSEDAPQEAVPYRESLIEVYENNLSQVMTALLKLDAEYLANADAEMKKELEEKASKKKEQEPKKDV